MAKRLTITRVDSDNSVFKRTWEKPVYGERYTDDKLRDLSTKLHIVYQQAASDLYAKQADWIHAHEKRVEKYSAEVEAGLLSKKDFEAWMRGQLFQEKAWELKRGQLARLMADADAQAMAMINRGKLEVFAENANWMNYKIEQDTGITATFGLFNADAVARILMEDPSLLPVQSIDVEKDVKWYNKIMQNAVIQGILQGETLDQIALRISEEAGDKGLNAIRRQARTAYTSAMNAGSLMAMENARDKYGIELQKRWMATLDDRTRDSHARLDGQVQDIDEPFDSLLGPIMWPGDPDAEPANVWNCRCWMDEYYPGYDNTRARYDVDGNFVGDVSYEEWMREQMEEGD